MNVTVRKFTKEDIPNKVRWINNPDNNAFLHYNIPLNISDTEKWFEGIKDKPNRYDYVICADSVPVGLIGLLNVDNINRKAEFYISMGEPSYKELGIGYASTKLILNFAFNELRLNKVYLNVDSKNLPACKLYEKVGFICEGEFLKDLWHHNEFIDRKRYAIFAPKQSELEILKGIV